MLSAVCGGDRCDRPKQETSCLSPVALNVTHKQEFSPLLAEHEEFWYSSSSTDSYGKTQCDDFLSQRMTVQVAAHTKMQECGINLARLSSCRIASLGPEHQHTLLLAESTTPHARHPSPNTSKNIEQDFRAFPETHSILVRHMKTRSRAPGWPSVPGLERRPGVRQELQEDEGRPKTCRHGRRICVLPSLQGRRC